MKKTSLITLFIAFLVSVLFLSFPKDKSPAYSKYVHEITTPFLKFLKKEYGITCSGTGGGFLTNINEVFLALASREYNVGIDRARELQVNFTEELIRRINKDEKVRPYLSHYPYTEQGIKLSLTFPRSSYDTKSITHVSIINGNVVYARPNVETGLLESIFEEPYEEAVRIVKEQGKLGVEG